LFHAVHRCTSRVATQVARSSYTCALATVRRRHQATLYAGPVHAARSSSTCALSYCSNTAEAVCCTCSTYHNS
jgi:hypothetical protein